MLILVDFLSVSPRLTAELKACLQPAAFALMDALTSFEVNERKCLRWTDEQTTLTVDSPHLTSHPQIQHMHAALLDAAGQALLKKLHGDYQQRFKFRGRV